MATEKNPEPTTPYSPAGGLNADAQGLSIGLTETPYVKNMRIDSAGAQTREGSVQLAGNVLGSEVAPIHYASYKEPAGDDKLFAFLQGYIYQYWAAEDAWGQGVDYSYNSDFGGCETTTGWTTDLDSIATSTNNYRGSSALKVVSATGSLLDGDELFYKQYATGWDTSGYTGASIFFVVSAEIDVTIQWFSDTAATAQLGTDVDVTLGSNTDRYSNYVFAAANGTVKAFKILVDGDQTLGADFFMYLDYITASSGPPSAISRWETTEFVDQGEGATLVAICSDPPEPNQDESDQANRDIFYWKTSTEMFMPLTMYKHLQTSEEDTGQTGPGGLADVAGDCNNITGSDTLVPGTFFLYTAEVGTIATGSSIPDSAGAGKYALVPVNTDAVQEGTVSYVQTDGNWRCRFLTAAYSGLKIYVTYTEKTEVDYKPRYCWNFRDHLVIASTYEDSLYMPWRIRWSNAGEMDVFADADYQDLLTSGAMPITGGDFQGGYLNIFQGGSISRMAWTGAEPIFSFTTIWQQGTYASRTLQTAQYNQYFLGEDDVYVFTGSEMSSLTKNPETGETRVRDMIFDLLDPNDINGCFAVINNATHEYWLFIKSGGDTYASHVFVYNIDLGIWSYFLYDNISCAGMYKITEVLTIDGLIGTIDEQNWRLNESFGAAITGSVVLGKGVMAPVVKKSVSTDYAFTSFDGVWNSGSGITSELITRDFVFENLANMDRLQKVVFEASGTEVGVGWNANYELNASGFSQYYLIPLNGEAKERFYFPDVMLKHARIGFVSTEPLNLRWVQTYVVEEELSDE